jgi:ureidoacrylate peracid hydrolase
MDPKSTAVVLIEYQNDFTTEGGTLHQAVKPVMDETNMLANTIETVKKARELGATIVYAPITFTEDYRELSPSPYGVLKGVVDKSFRQGTWGAQIVDALKPAPATSSSKASGACAASPPPTSISSCAVVAYRPLRSADF